MNKGKRIAALLIAFAMLFTGILSNAPSAEAAKKKVKIKSVSVASSLSGNKKTVYVAKGKKVKLATTVKATPNKKANKKVSYKSKNSKIASVSASGVIKGIKPGSTKITVTSKSNKKKKAAITVKVMKAPVTKVTLKQKKATLEKGAKLSLKATVKAKKGAVKTVGWKSSNPKAATVSSKGVVSAVGAGTATITAQAIDGSNKKASCKVTVNDSVSLTGMKILNSNMISFSLNKAFSLSAGQISVHAKSYVNGAYRGNVKISALSTNDQRNYRLSLHDNIYTGSYIRLSIPALQGNKILECQYLDPVCAYTDDVVRTGWVGDEFSDDFSFGSQEMGYSQYAINRLPAGLTATPHKSYLEISGTPTQPGVTQAVFTAVDELGNTMTKNIYFAIGSDTVMAGAAAPRYIVSTDAGATYVSPSIVGGSGSYRCQILADPKNSGAHIDGDGDIAIYPKTPGDYTVTVRATDTQNPARFCNFQAVFHVAQGISVSGYIKDAQGNPMEDAYVRFINKNLANRYAYSGGLYTNEKGIYTATLIPGTYDVKISYGDSTESIAGFADNYIENQAMTASRSGYDFTLPLYKVSLISGNTDASLNRTWYINNKRAGYGSTLYLRPGTYTLTSDITNSGGNTHEAWNGSWFSGMTLTRTYSDVRLSAAVRVINTAVQASVVSTPTGQSTTETYRYPAAKDSDYTMDCDGTKYSLPEESVYDTDGDWYADADAYTARVIQITETADYILGSYSGYVQLYDQQGAVIEPSSEAEEQKTYASLPAGTYYVGTGSYSTYDTDICMWNASNAEY